MSRNSEKGGPGWKLHVLRRSLIPALRQDLHDLAYTGLSPNECNDVKSFFQSILAQAKTSPDQALNRKEILDALENLYESYAEWNSYPQRSEEGAQMRNKTLGKIKSSRTEWVEKLRQNQEEISEALNHDIIDPILERLGTLTAKYTYFPNLRAALQKYRKIADAA